uniref:Uncharacterized protein n=1 Tax=Heterorhabditis bacteriophora TaxID=37862 RepID=A0A1I7WVF4_HETBA
MFYRIYMFIILKICRFYIVISQLIS